MQSAPAWQQQQNRSQRLGCSGGCWMLPLALPLMLYCSQPAGQPHHPGSHVRSPLLPCSSPQTDRDSSLQSLGRLLTPAVFGTPRQHGLPSADGGLLSDTGAHELAITFASSLASACLQRCCTYGLQSALVCKVLCSRTHLFTPCRCMPLTLSSIPFTHPRARTFLPQWRC